MDVKPGGNSNIPVLETTYRLGLKHALSIREGTNTEIVYIESYIKTTTLFLVKFEFLFTKEP